MAQRRVLRWTVPVDDQPWRIGTGPVVLVACRNDERIARGEPRSVEVWTDETLHDDWPEVDTSGWRRAQVYGTGQPVPAGAKHLGSALDAGGRLVWHLFTVGGPE